MDDKTYRAIANDLLDELTGYFDDWDPDVIEAELVPGALTLTTADGLKYIVSEQGAHKQIWLATPESGRRYDYDEASKRWLDNKDSSDLLQELAAALTERVGKTIDFA